MWKFSGKAQFPHNFRTRKLAEITAFYTVEECIKYNFVAPISSKGAKKVSIESLIRISEFDQNSKLLYSGLLCKKSRNTEFFLAPIWTLFTPGVGGSMF